MRKKEGKSIGVLTVLVVLPAILLFTVGAESNAQYKPAARAPVLLSDDPAVWDNPAQPKATQGTGADPVYQEGIASGLDSDSLEDIQIKVYFKSTNETKTISLEEYVKGVIVGEMPLYFDEEALKAQAVAARTYTLYRMQHGGANAEAHKDGAVVCTDSGHCQAWRDPQSIFTSYGKEKAEIYYAKLCKAVEETRRIVVTYEDNLINALYFDNSGGWTECVQNVWGGKALAYLQSVPSGGEAESASFCTLKYFRPADFVSKLKAEDGRFQASADNVFDSIQNIVRNESGRLQTVSIGGVTFEGTTLRKVLNLRSTNMLFQELEDGTILLVTFGFGHGVGMSQWGAQAMAQDGASYEEILKHYYTGVTVELYVFG